MAVPEQEGWLEQDPSDWWTATASSLHSLVRELDPEQIKAVGLSGEMHGLVALDKNNNVIRNAILWNDERSAAEYNDIIDGAGLDSIFDADRSIIPHYVESKLYWIKQNEPENYERIAKFVMPKDYIRYMLTGVVAEDTWDASNSMFFNTEDQEWDNEIVSKVGFDIIVFPPVADSNSPCGTVTEGASLDTGLSFNIPVYGAGVDTVMENASMSLVHEDAVALVLGPSAVVSAVSKDIPNVGGGRLRTLSIHGGDSYMVYGRQLSCGDSFEWAQKALYGLETDPAAAFLETAAKAPIGSDGVIFLPYLMGERTPHIDPNAKAVFYGLSMMTKQADLARSVMEGVVFGLYEIYQLIRKENHKVDPKEVIVSGSASGSDLLKQIIADVFNLPVKVYQGALEGGAYGAALTAGVGEKLFTSFAEAEKLHHITEVYQPNGGNHTLYMHNLELFEKLYKDLRKMFEETAIQR